jgi:hypothetical protein
VVRRERPEGFTQRRGDAKKARDSGFDWRLGQVAIDVAAVADSDYEHDQDLILDLIDDAVVADADAIEFFFAGELLNAAGPGVGGKPVDLLGDADSGFWRANRGPMV